MSFINTYIGTPLGWIMWLCYRLVRKLWDSYFIVYASKQGDFAAAVHCGAEKLY